ncbi:Uncharacterized protein Rs2_37267 [Raphanus sativus]|nr:Uncharacterized protein Rs2_37267 [Raphanus sativus]
MEMETAPPWTSRIPTCQIDASWIANGSVSGLGWSFKDHMGSELFGLRAETDLFRSLQEGFEDVRVSHIPRDRNGRADALAKEARNRSYTFIHIDQTRSDGGDPRRTDSSNHHLI